MAVQLSLSSRRLESLSLIEKRGELSPAEVADQVPCLLITTAYNMLRRLEAQGVVASRIKKIEGERNRPRRLYSLTADGVELLQAHRARMASNNIEAGDCEEHF